MKFAELSALYDQPLFDLISQSRALHLRHWHGERWPISRRWTFSNWSG
jgi:hypothetical protein